MSFYLESPSYTSSSCNSQRNWASSTAELINDENVDPKSQETRRIAFLFQGLSTERDRTFCYPQLDIFVHVPRVPVIEHRVISAEVCYDFEDDLQDFPHNYVADSIDSQYTDMVTPQLSFQDVLDKQVQSRIFNGVYWDKRMISGPNQNIFHLPAAWAQILVVPKNRAFISNKLLHDGLQRVSLPKRFRFLRGENFSFEYNGRLLTVQHAVIEDLIYDPEYTLEYDPKDGDGTGVIDGEEVSRQRGLCPYCPEPNFLPLYNTSYRNHLYYYHGIFADSYIVPDPFNDDHSSDKSVLCPSCACSIPIAKHASNTMLHKYLKHFKQKHQHKVSPKGQFRLLDPCDGIAS